MSLPELGLLSVVVVVVALIAAFLAIRKGEVGAGFLAGLSPIAALQCYLQGSLQASIKSCLEKACASSSLPPDCRVGEFGCMEGGAPGIVLGWAIGLIQAVIFLIGFGLMVWWHHRRMRRL